MRISLLAYGAALLLCHLPSALADQVILKNGDIISGRVVNKSGDVLIVNTGYAGDIKIQWKEISTLSTDKPVPALLNDDRYVKTSFLPAERGRVRLTGEDAETQQGGADAAIDNKPYGLNDILYLNPTPEESGRGYRYSGRANVAITNTSGNSNNQVLHMDGEIQKRARAYRYTLGGEINRNKDNETRTVSNSRLYASYDRFYTPTNFVYVHGALENDRFKDIRQRSVFGPGYGYQVYESETTKLSIKGGPDLVSIDRYVAESERFVALGWHVDFTHKTARFPAEIFHIQDGYRGLNSKGDLVLKTRTGVRIPLRDGFFANAQYNLDWENHPAPGRKNSDRQLLIGLGYVF